MHQFSPRQDLRLPISGTTLIRIAEPLVEVRGVDGELLAVVSSGQRESGVLLEAWSGRGDQGPWAMAVGFGYAADGLTLRFLRHSAGTSFLRQVTGWPHLVDNGDAGSLWVAEVAGDYAAVSFVSDHVREARGLTSTDGAHLLSLRAG